MLKKNNDIKKEIIRILPKGIREIFSKINLDYKKLTEIRLRADKPILINYNTCEYFISNYGELSDLIEDAYVICEEEIKELLQYVCNYSVYAHEEDIKQGFITIVGGHRIGLAGKVVIEGDRIKNIKNISCVNIRVSHQVIGCARKIMPYIYDEENNLCIIGTSKWVLIDIETGKIAKITEEIYEKYQIEEKSVFNIEELDKLKAPEEYSSEID